MDRRHELESARRSPAMLTPCQQALRREEAIGLVEELADLSARLRRSASLDRSTTPRRRIGA